MAGQLMRRLLGLFWVQNQFVLWLALASVLCPIRTASTSNGFVEGMLSVSLKNGSFPCQHQNSTVVTVGITINGETERRESSWNMKEQHVISSVNALCFGQTKNNGCHINNETMVKILSVYDPDEHFTVRYFCVPTSALYTLCNGTIVLQEKEGFIVSHEYPRTGNKDTYTCSGDIHTKRTLDMEIFDCSVEIMSGMACYRGLKFEENGSFTIDYEMSQYRGKGGLVIHYKGASSEPASVGLSTVIMDSSVSSTDPIISPITLETEQTDMFTRPNNENISQDVTANTAFDLSNESTNTKNFRISSSTHINEFPLTNLLTPENETVLTSSAQSDVITSARSFNTSSTVSEFSTVTDNHTADPTAINPLLKGRIFIVLVICAMLTAVVILLGIYIWNRKCKDDHMTNTKSTDLREPPDGENKHDPREGKGKRMTTDILMKKDSALTEHKKMETETTMSPKDRATPEVVVPRGGGSVVTYVDIDSIFPTNDSHTITAEQDDVSPYSICARHPATEETVTLSTEEGYCYYESVDSMRKNGKTSEQDGHASKTWGKEEIFTSEYWAIGPGEGNVKISTDVISLEDCFRSKGINDDLNKQETGGSNSLTAGSSTDLDYAVIGKENVLDLKPKDSAMDGDYAVLNEQIVKDLFKTNTEQSRTDIRYDVMNKKRNNEMAKEKANQPGTDGNYSLLNEHMFRSSGPSVIASGDTEPSLPNSDGDNAVVHSETDTLKEYN